MAMLIHIFALCGIFGLGCLIVVLSGCLGIFAGAYLGASIAVGIFGGSEDRGVNIGCPWGFWLGALWASFCIYCSGLSAAVLASLGLALVVLILAGLIWLCSPGRPIDPDYPA